MPFLSARPHFALHTGALSQFAWAVDSTKSFAATLNDDLRRARRRCDDDDDDGGGERPPHADVRIVVHPAASGPPRGRSRGV